MEITNADAWLVAFAKAKLDDNKKYVIVTFESFHSNIKRKIPLPNVCKAFNIPYCDLFKMLKDLKFSF